MVKQKITVIGAGSLGSFFLLLIAKMASAFGWEITAYDFDVVEKHNTLNQLYSNSDVGKFKVEALKNTIKSQTGREINIVNERVNDKSGLSGIVVVLVDNMLARKEIFEACKNNYNVTYYIEARSGGDMASVHALDPRDPDSIELYEKTLYSDARAVPAPCADQTTVPTLWAVATAISRLLTRTCTKKVIIDEYIEVGINMSDLLSVVTKVL